MNRPIAERLKHSARNYFLRNRSFLNRYFTALFILAISLTVYEGLFRFEGTRLNSVVFAACVLSAFHGGIGPAILTSLIGSLTLDYFFVEPVYQAFDSANSVFRVLVFATIASLVSIMVAVLQSEFIRTERLKEIEAATTQSMDRLLKIVAHDLRNPLSVIIGTIDTIPVSNTASNTQLPEHLKRIERSCLSAMALIDELQKFSVTIPTFSFEENVDVTRLIADCITDTSGLAKKKSVQIHLKVEQELVAPRADRQKLVRIVTNYLTNAIKYSPQNTQISVHGYTTANWIIVKVIDQGPGIKPEEQKQLFSAFYRTSNQPTSKDDTSTGLGLSIVKQLVDGHGGEIFYENISSGGSSFGFKLPLFNDNLKKGEKING